MFSKLHEEIGSPDKELILKGKVRILWGKKFIDLLDSNGNLNVKVRSLIKSIDSSDEIKDDGFYYLNDGLVAKVGDNIFEITSNSENNIYVSFVEEQEVTEDQKLTALKNIGFIYNSKNSNNVYPKNGIVYFSDELTLYVINNGNLIKYRSSITNPITELVIIDKNDLTKGALVISGSGELNSLVFDNLKIYSDGNVSVYNANKIHLFLIGGYEFLRITSNSIEGKGFKLVNGNESILYVDKVVTKSITLNNNESSNDLSSEEFEEGTEEGGDNEGGDSGGGSSGGESNYTTLEGLLKDLDDKNAPTPNSSGYFHYNGSAYEWINPTELTISGEIEDLMNSIALSNMNSELTLDRNNVVLRANDSTSILVNVTSNAIWYISKNPQTGSFAEGFPRTINNKVKGFGNLSFSFVCDDSIRYNSFNDRTALIIVKDLYYDKLLLLGLSDIILNKHKKIIQYTLKGKKELSFLITPTKISWDTTSYNFVLNSSYDKELIEIITLDLIINSSIYNYENETITISVTFNLNTSTENEKSNSIRITTIDELSETFTIILEKKSLE